MANICYYILFNSRNFITFTGIIGNNFAILDIKFFIFEILLGEYVIYKMLKQKNMYKVEMSSFILLIILLLCFMIFTIYSPKIHLFEDPIYGTFGLEPKRID